MFTGLSSMLMVAVSGATTPAKILIRVDLAGAVLAHQRMDLAGGDIEIDTGNAGMPA